MKKFLKFTLLIVAALIAGGAIGWVGGLIGYETPTIVAIIIALGASVHSYQLSKKREQVA